MPSLPTTPADAASIEINGSLEEWSHQIQPIVNAEFNAFSMALQSGGDGERRKGFRLLSGDF
jgi:hypothetical protein